MGVEYEPPILHPWLAGGLGWLQEGTTLTLAKFVRRCLASCSKQARTKEVRKKERKEERPGDSHPPRCNRLFVCLFVAAAWPLNCLCM